MEDKTHGTITQPDPPQSPTPPVSPLPQDIYPSPRHISKKLVIIVGIVVLLMVSGIAGFTYFKPSPAIDKVVPPLQPTATPSPTDPTADWKTYRNDEYGFTLKHPSEWEINERKDQPEYYTFGVSFSPPETCPEDASFNCNITGFLFIKIIENSQKLSIEEYLKTTKYSYNNDPKFTDVNVDNSVRKRTLEIEGGFGTKTNTVFLEENNIIYELQWSHLDSSKQSEKITDKIFDQILSTFKFFESTKVNVNDEIIYSAPAQWEIIKTRDLDYHLRSPDYQESERPSITNGAEISFYSSRYDVESRKKQTLEMNKTHNRPGVNVIGEAKFGNNSYTTIYQCYETCVEYYYLENSPIEIVFSCAPKCDTKIDLENNKYIPQRNEFLSSVKLK